MDFEVHRARVRGVDIAYWREGVGGRPLLLLHGWPETKRIWARNVRPLAEAGFEVIVPDMRGFGDSGLADDGFYDVAAESNDMEALVRGELRHERVVTCGGDLGGVVLQDMALRFPGLVERQVMFNTVLPVLGKAYEDAGIDVGMSPVTLMAADYFARQARDADGLAAELSSPELRTRYVAQMYGPRFWAAPGAFTPDDIAWHCEPFGDADRFRASIANYESAMGTRERSELPRFMEPNPTLTLVLYGPEDHVIPATFPRAAEVAFPNRMGPFVVPGAGHFMQWERAELLNNAVRHFCPDPAGSPLAELVREALDGYSFSHGPTRRETAEAAGRIRRDTGVRTPDALIAATALLHRLTLLTRNRRDFDRVPRLRTRAPR